METVSLKNSAFVSVDNTRTFEDKSLDELYVPEGERAASRSKKVADICKTYGILTINVLEGHPLGHISLAANYKDKKAYEFITYDEVKDRTEEDNGIGARAEFTLSQLKAFLEKVGSQRLRPDHSIQNTPGIKLTPPLQASDFDLTIIKGTNPAKEAYGGFDETDLDSELKNRDIQKLFIAGVATDYCIGKTALDAAGLRYGVYVISDAVRGVAEDTTSEMIELLTSKGVQFIGSDDFDRLVQQSFDPERIAD